MERKTESFLQALYEDCQTEMRWRRDVEYKLMGSLIPLCPALVGGLFALSAILPPGVVAGTAAALTLFVWILYVYVSRKVYAEHETYAGLGQVVVKIWENFGLFDETGHGGEGGILPEPSKKYGQGDGHRITLGVFFWLSVTTTVMLLGLGALAVTGHLRSQQVWTSGEALRHGLEIVRDAEPQTKSWTVSSFEWRSDRKEYVLIALREGQQEGYSVALNPATRSVVRLAIEKLEPANEANQPTKP
jgi:hypothetical protein